MSSTSPMPAESARPTTGAIATPIAISASSVWLIGAVVLALLAYYFIGVDQGMVSVFGNDTHVHEFVHDARHFLGFPCH
jgi:putative cobalt transporter subunit CbtB